MRNTIDCIYGANAASQKTVDHCALASGVVVNGRQVVIVHHICKEQFLDCVVIGASSSVLINQRLYTLERHKTKMAYFCRLLLWLIEE